MIWELGGKGSGTNIYSQKPVTCVIYEVPQFFPYRRNLTPSYIQSRSFAGFISVALVAYEKYLGDNAMGSLTVFT
jgi:hypothetical protein